MGIEMQVKVATTQDRKKWDAFLAQQVNGNFRQSFAWGQIKKLAGWDPICLYVEEGGIIKAAISIFKRKIPFTGRSIFYGCRGPVLDWKDSASLKKLVAGITQYAKLHKCIFLRIDPEPVDEDLMRKQLHSLSFLSVDYPYTAWNRTRYELRVFLQGNEDELFKRIRRNTRQNINSGYQKGITVKVGFEEGDDQRFFELLSRLETEKKAIHHNFDYYKAVIHEITFYGNGTLIKAVYENKIISVMVVAFVGNKCWAVYMANDYNYRKLMPNKLIMWEGIKLAKKKGCIFFDMGATQGASFNHYAKLDNYKMAYRPQVVHFPEYFDIVFSPFFYRILKAAEFKFVPLFYKLKTMRLTTK
jgi:lipid II:glycine glycyltransferase (peptidoglycan interpeptide bridge formation enzyme)